MRKELQLKLTFFSKVVVRVFIYCFFVGLPGFFVSEQSSFAKEDINKNCSNSPDKKNVNQLTQVAMNTIDVTNIKSTSYAPPEGSDNQNINCKLNFSNSETQDEKNLHAVGVIINKNGTCRQWQHGGYGTDDSKGNCLGTASLVDVVGLRLTRQFGISAAHIFQDVDTGKINPNPDGFYYITLMPDPKRKKYIVKEYKLAVIQARTRNPTMDPDRDVVYFKLESPVDDLRLQSKDKVKPFLLDIQKIKEATLLFQKEKKINVDTVGYKKSKTEFQRNCSPLILTELTTDTRFWSYSKIMGLNEFPFEPGSSGAPFLIKDLNQVQSGAESENYFFGIHTQSGLNVDASLLSHSKQKDGKISMNITLLAIAFADSYVDFVKSNL